MAKKTVARRRFLKQSTAAAALAASHLAAGAEDYGALSVFVQAAYRGPLSEVNVKDRQLDSQQFSLASFDEIKPSMSFAAKDKRTARLWQKRARAKVVELLGGFPGRRAALRPEVLERREFKGYTREKILFQSRDNLTVFGYLLLPASRSGAVPGVICLPGHGRGCDDIVGIAEDGSQRESKSGYSRDFALQAVEQGYAAFAIEQLAFGCRRDEAARKRGGGASSCQPAAGAALLFGQTMIG